MKTLCAIVVLSIGVVWRCLAVPACPEPFEAEHPDGGTKQFWLKGDEHLSWVEDEGGTVFVPAARRRLAYAEVAEGRLVPRAAGRRNRVQHAEAVALATQTALEATRAVAVAAPSATALAPRKLLVIVVGFSDIAPASTIAFWEERFFDDNGKTVKTYYLAASKGQFCFEPAAGGGVVGVTLPYAHPNTPNNGLSSTATKQVAYDALTAAETQVDFAALDTNADGRLTADELCLTLILAGYEGAKGGLPEPKVWGHNTKLSAPPVLNGVAVGGDSYTMQGERHGTLPGTFASIGIFCHELGHSLGLWDLYDYTDQSYGIGCHGLMGAGSWGRAGTAGFPGETPVCLSAFNRCFLGFTTPEVIANGTRSLVAASHATLADTDVLKISTATPTEYFLVENRQPTGFDQGLQYYFGSAVVDGGIAIWHIDETLYKYGANDNVARKAVDLEEANETALGYSQLDTKRNQGTRAHYFYAGNATAFTVATHPDSRDYSNKPSGVAITNIGASGPAMSVTVQTTRPDVPVGLTASIDLADRVRLAWQPSSLATSYKLYRSTNSVSTLIATLDGLTYDDLAVDYGYTYTYWLVAANADAESGPGASVNGYPAPLPLGASVGAPQYVWTTGGHVPWFGQTNITRTGVALQSGRITHSQNTWLETTITGPGVLKFYVRSSSEPNYDRLDVFTNNTYYGSRSGYTYHDWVPVLVELPAGDVAFRWRYSKDARTNRGDDACWLANLTLYLPSQNTPVPVPYDWLDPYYPDIEPDVSAIATGANGLPVWESYVADLNPTNSVSRFVARIAVTNDTPYISWTPDSRPKRRYFIEGKTNLADTVWIPTNSATRFFRVKVELP